MKIFALALALCVATSVNADSAWQPHSVLSPTLGAQPSLRDIMSEQKFALDSHAKASDQILSPPTWGDSAWGSPAASPGASKWINFAEALQKSPINNKKPIQHVHVSAHEQTGFGRRDREETAAEKFRRLTLAERSKPRFGCSSNYDLDYVRFSLSWAPGYCSVSDEKCTKQALPKFTIHGLWPARNAGEGPFDCCSQEKFNCNKLSSIKEELDTHWPSFMSNKNCNFWAHEWNKHGTCMKKVAGYDKQLAYFSKTLELLKNLNVEQVFRQRQIVPSNKKTYSANEVHAALRVVTGGKTAMLKCELQHKSNARIIKEVDFCYDTQGQLINCHVAFSRCSEEVLLLESQVFARTF